MSQGRTNVTQLPYARQELHRRIHQTGRGQEGQQLKLPAVTTGSGSGGAAEQNWCSVHEAMTRNDAGCYQQRAPRPQKDRAITTAVHGAHKYIADDDKHEGWNVNDDFGGGFVWTASTQEGASLLNRCGIMLVDSGATETFLDDE